MEVRSSCGCKKRGQALQCNSGQATLSFVILVSGIIVEVAIAGSFIAYFLSSSGLGERLSSRALATAQGGIRDAQVRIVRNKELGSTSYSLSVGSDTASVVVSRDASDPNVYVYTITSTGTAGNRERALVATLVVQKTTGSVQFQSVSELAIP